MLGAAHRRVHLQFRAEARDSPRRTASGDAASPRSLRRPWRRRGTPSPRASRRAAHAPARAPRGRGGSAARCSAAPRSRRATPDARTGRPRRAGACARSSRASSSLWKAARRRIALQDREHARVVGDEQLAGRRAHEHLDPRRARKALELGNVGDIVVRAADPEGEVAMHAAFGARDLVGERRRRSSSAGRCWAFRTPPSRRRARRRASRSPDPPCARARARGNAPGCRSRRAERAARGSRCARPPRRAQRSPIAAIRPSRTPTSRSPIAVLIDHGPVRQNAIERLAAWPHPCVRAACARQRPPNLPGLAMQARSEATQ